MFGALHQIDKIDNVRSLRLGKYVLGPFFVLMTGFMMWMQVREYYVKHEEWRIASFAMYLLWNYAGVEIIRRCNGRIQQLEKLANESVT